MAFHNQGGHAAKERAAGSGLVDAHVSSGQTLVDDIHYLGDNVTNVGVLFMVISTEFRCLISLDLRGG
jgi:hypothetical protein